MGGCLWPWLEVTVSGGGLQRGFGSGGGPGRDALKPHPDPRPARPSPPSSQQSHLHGGRAKLHLSPKHFSPSLLQDAGPAPNLPGQVQGPVPKSPSVPLKGPSVCQPVSLLPRGPRTWKLQPQAEAGTQIPGWASDEQSTSRNQETGLQSRLALN